MVHEHEHVGQAFALVFAAGAATAIGSMVVFFPRLGVKLANRRTLAASLGLAAGVMIYVSLVDIYQKSMTAFEDQGFDNGMAFIYTTLCFFGGCFLMMLLNKIVELLLSFDKSASIVEEFFDPESTNTKTSATANPGDGLISSRSEEEAEQQQQQQKPNVEALQEPQSQSQHDHCTHSPVPGLSDHSVQQMAEIQRMASELSEKPPPPQQQQPQQQPQDDDNDNAQVAAIDNKTHNRHLFRMGAATALAIAIHNFPEGFVTYVAYMEDPALGIPLAVGIAIHNIPEGLCVSMPLFYATGNRCTSFWWGVLSGVSEPLGAIIGWALLNSDVSNYTSAIMFGVVSGIMAYVSLDELLPTAHRYDPGNTVVTKALLVGMFSMALSLMLFSV